MIRDRDWVLLVLVMLLFAAVFAAGYFAGASHR